MASSSLKNEVDQILDDMKDWEMSMALELSDADLSTYYQKKRDHLQTFFIDQVAFWESEQTKKADKSAQSKVDDEARKQIELEMQKEAEAARVASETAKAQAQAKAATASKAEEEASRAQKEREEAQALVAKKAKETEAAEAQERANTAAAETARANAEAAEKAKRQANTTSPTPSEPDAPRPAMIAREDLEDAANVAAAADAALEKEMKEAVLRIAKQPTRQQADLTDPVIISTYIRIRNHRDDLDWMMLGYSDNAQPSKLSVIGCGTGGWYECVKQIPEDACFIYMDYKFGDTARSKFVFMSFVPDTLSSMKKSRVVGHRPAVEKLLKYMQITWHVLERHDIKRETLDQKLLAAGGANYSVQESDKGDFSSYKKNTADFYSEKEKEGTLTGIVYEKGPLTTTPMDISGRSMVAAPSEARANIVDLGSKK